MKGKNDFINYVEKILNENEISEDGLKFWKFFKENKDIEKHLLNCGSQKTSQNA